MLAVLYNYPWACLFKPEYGAFRAANDHHDRNEQSHTQHVHTHMQAGAISTARNLGGASGDTITATQHANQSHGHSPRSHAGTQPSNHSTQNQRRAPTPPDRNDQFDDDGLSDRGCNHARKQGVSSGQTDTSQPRRRIKVDNIEIDDMPAPGNLRQWRVDMREKVTDAYSIDPDAALAWIKEIDTARSVECLATSTLPELEVQLAKAVKKCIKKNHVCHAMISQLIEQGQQTGARLTSRQIIYLLYEYLRPNIRGEDMYELQDLFAVKLGAHERKCSIEELASFMLRWDTCVLYAD